jgi:hypothetical protein
MAYGRRRAAARLARPGYTPHPAWRHLIAPEYRVLTDQAEALRIVQAAVDNQDWRADKRVAWLAILRQLVYAMDWDTGLVAACTAQRLGTAGARAPRTVSRVIAWAREVGLLVVVEHGASAEFLGTDHGRTPTYALVTDAPLPHPAPSNSHVTELVDELGDPTEFSRQDQKPLRGERLTPTTPAASPWPAFGVPQTPAERTAATICLLKRLGLDGGRGSGVPLWRARALLRPWWDAGACPAGLLWAIDHHPDHPLHHRGDALRGARDPLGVLGSRLRPWRRRLDELPAAVTGVRGDYTTARPEPEPAPAASPVPVDPPTRGGSPSMREAAKAAVAAHLTRLRISRQTTRVGN